MGIRWISTLIPAAASPVQQLFPALPPRHQMLLLLRRLLSPRDSREEHPSSHRGITAATTSLPRNFRLTDISTPNRLFSTKWRQFSQSILDVLESYWGFSKTRVNIVICTVSFVVVRVREQGYLVCQDNRYNLGLSQAHHAHIQSLKTQPLWAL